jgi:hypothetical protein
VGVGGDGRVALVSLIDRHETNSAKVALSSWQYAMREGDGLSERRTRYVGGAEGRSVRGRRNLPHALSSQAVEQRATRPFCLGGMVELGRFGDRLAESALGRFGDRLAESARRLEAHVRGKAPASVINERLIGFVVCHALHARASRIADATTGFPLFPQRDGRARYGILDVCWLQRSGRNQPMILR